MLEGIKLVLSIACLAGTASSFACSTADAEKLWTRVRVPPSLFTKMDNKATATFPAGDTQCLRFFFKRTKTYAGDLCVSSNPDFLRDRSVVPYDSIPTHARSSERPDSGLVVLSPSSQYPLEPFMDQEMRTFGTIIDCDEVNDVIYRPTASCHVAVSTSAREKVVFTNFIMKSHGRRSPRVSIEDIKKLWHSLTP